MCQLNRLFKIILDQLFLVQRADTCTRQSTNGIQHKLTKLYLLHQLFCLPLKSKNIILLLTVKSPQIFVDAVDQINILVLTLTH